MTQVHGRMTDQWVVETDGTAVRVSARAPTPVAYVVARNGSMPFRTFFDAMLYAAQQPAAPR